MNSYLFAKDAETYKFKAKDSEISGASSCLGNISKHISTDNIKKTELYGYVSDFSVDYDNIDVVDILDIHKFLIKNAI